MTLSDNISKKEVSRLIGLSESTIVRLVQKNIFPLPYRLGGRTFFSRQEVKQWEQDQKLKRGFAPQYGRERAPVVSLNVNKAQ